MLAKGWVALVAVSTWLFHRIFVFASTPTNHLSNVAGLTLATALFGFVRKPELRPEWIWLDGIAIYFGLVAVVLEIPDFRYRLVLEAVLIVIAVLGYAPKQSPELSRRSERIPNLKIKG